MVHGDLKPDNFLVEFNEEKTMIKDIKLVDFGSSFLFDEELNISDSTPEYLSPELLSLLI